MGKGVNLIDYNQQCFDVKKSEYEKQVLINDVTALELLQCVIDDRISLMKETQVRHRLRDMGIKSRVLQNAYIAYLVEYFKKENEESKAQLKDKIRIELKQMYEDAVSVKERLSVMDRMIKLDGLAEPSKHMVARVNVEWGNNSTETVSINE